MQPKPDVCVRVLFLVVLALRSALNAASANPPANDTCAGAVLVTGVPFLSTPIDISEATTVGDPPLPPPSTFFDPAVTRSVWYRFRPTAGGLYTLSVAYDTATTILDTSMVIYTSGGGDCAGATNIYAFNEDSGLLRSAISTNFNAGVDYYVVVWVGSIETATNGLILQLRVTKPVVPLNDTCAGAEIIPTVPYLTAVTDTTLATTTPNLIPSCAPTDIDREPSRDVWYRFQPPATGTYIFSTKAGETATSVDDTLISIYTSTTECNGFSEVGGACNDNDVGRSVFAVGLTAGVTYYIVVWDNSPDVIPGETFVQLHITAASRPDVVTMVPVTLASTGAVLRGSVNANGLQTRFWFEWGPTSGLGSTSQVKQIFANSTVTLDTNLTVKGFLPNTVYHYRFVAANSLGQAQGEERTFLWSDAAPRLDAPFRTPGGTFGFEFVGNPLQLYAIQATTNLASWEDVGLATNIASNQFRFVHSLGGLEHQRSYRAKLP